MAEWFTASPATLPETPKSRGPRGAGGRRRVLLGLAVALSGLMLLGPFVPGATSSTPMGLSGAAPHCADVPPRAACAAPAAPVLRPESHNLTVTVENPRDFVGAAVPFESALPPGGSAISYQWQFGDGRTNRTASDSTTHVYSSPGFYPILDNATNALGGYYTDLASVPYVQIVPTVYGDDNGTTAQLLGTFLSNASYHSGVPLGVLVPGSWVSAEAWVESAPINPLVTLGSPTVSAPGGINVSYQSFANGTVYLTVTTTVHTAPGLYDITYTIDSMGPNLPGGSVANSYVFGLVVGPGLASATDLLPSPPRPGTVVAFEDIGTPASVDPALIAPDASGEEIVENVYQTLIAPNGTLVGPNPGDFVPEVAACVPGSVQCESLFGSELTSGSQVTFVISAAPRFFDNSTGHAWPVYPTDVVFSIARDLAFTDLPSFGDHPGWALASMLLPGASASSQAANDSWDSGLHYPYNTTPQAVLSSMSVNASGLCPTSALSSPGLYHGCVTFNLEPVAGGAPTLLPALSEATGAAIVPCGWVSAPATSGGQQGIPYWTESAVSGNGNYPCEMPGVGPFGDAPGEIPYTGWDQWELNGSDTPGHSAIGQVGEQAVGSGPFYLNRNNTQEFVLTVNPDYVNVSGCTWSGCPPTVGAYPSHVRVVYESGTSDGESSILHGTADFAEVSPYDANFLNTSTETGGPFVVSLPTATSEFESLNLDYNVTLMDELGDATYTAPATFLTDPNVREFVTRAFPYGETMANVSELPGALWEFPAAGGLPSDLGTPVATNVSWPSGNPNGSGSSPPAGSAGWWWKETAADSDVGRVCTSSKPCSFPLVYPAGSTLLETTDTLWAKEIDTLSGGALDPVALSVSLLDLIDDFFTKPGANPYPAVDFSLEASIPDLSSPLSGLYEANSTVPYYDAVSLELDPLSGGSCSSAPGYWSSLSTPVPLDCQGSAFDALQALLRDIGTTAPGSSRSLEFAMAEQIASRLALAGGTFEQMDLQAVAPWFELTSLVNDPFLDTAGVHEWAYLRYLSFPAPPLSEATGSVVLTTTLNVTDVNVPFTLHAIPVGTARNFSYVFTGLPVGCSSAGGPNVTCFPTAKGSYLIDLFANASTGVPLVANVSVTVDPLPAIASFSTYAPQGLLTGIPFWINTTIKGGTAPFNYTYAGLPTGCLERSIALIPCTVNTSGTYHVTVTTRDALGSYANDSLRFTVASNATTVISSPKSSTGFLGLPGDDGYYLLGGIVAAAVAGAIAYVALGRKGRPPGAAATEGGGGPAEGAGPMEPEAGATAYPPAGPPG